MFFFFRWGGNRRKRQYPAMLTVAICGYMVRLKVAHHFSPSLSFPAPSSLFPNAGRLFKHRNLNIHHLKIERKKTNACEHIMGDDTISQNVKEKQRKLEMRKCEQTLEMRCDGTVTHHVQNAHC
ncbi:hypothetical protein, unlikely [Trypanosoma brucei gambiense DAL972]|uniref:Uncharacterized protein n=1 Tax=Trypanosoma brucei gambiense (strain MHOM/CI/86/DAL972) TaxID=679716 RepID=D0A1N8_TRYB9|nr:hypothetical protein, unlikely [Trypanosoma brucei gambiense DAL972]CBH15181.1 hypothetical protein, unlikely [Trypanosoma brucei gambiense DAL972]|eukprot:XP_011777446.1 hypothetical protein, unlikely [Trypanosoma brucei gambiense DAL972]